MNKLKLLSRKEYDQWIKDLPPNTCTFCDWKKYQVVLKEFTNWVWIANIAPYWWWHTMVMSKRHFVDFEEATPEEIKEFLFILAHINKKFIDAKLEHADGSLVDRYVYFWRMRVNRRDMQTGAIKPDHFHIHFSPDRDHSWDSTHENGAETCDVLGRLGENK